MNLWLCGAAWMSGSAFAGEPHLVSGRFEASPDFGSVTFRFEVDPPIGARPTVRLLGRPTDPPTTLEVADEADGRYAVTVVDLPSPVAQGQLLIEVPVEGWVEPHRASFVIRPTDPTQRMTHPSLDGNLRVSVDPTDVPKDARLLLTRVERPLDGLPEDLGDAQIQATWSVDVQPPAWGYAGWVLDIGAAVDPAPTLWWRADGSPDWKRVDVAVAAGAGAVITDVPGPGTWLVAGGGGR
ncbi:MAG: hypothetical protein ABMB14_07395 [Myxococcota bacterium]